MKPKDRQKMCSHCEGRIPVEASSCPYCGMPLIGDSMESRGALSSQESLSSLYPPPYSSKNQVFSPQESTGSFQRISSPSSQPINVHGGHMNSSSASMSNHNPLLDSMHSVHHKVDGKGEEEKGSIMPLFLVLVGANLLTLGLMQGMFSEGGILRLEWNSQYWFVYCLFAIPMIYAGLKKAKQMKETS